MSGGQIIYIVDDDPDVRRGIAFMLEAGGRESRGFANGEAFLDALPSLAPGCVLLDVRMPAVDGLEVLAEIEKRRLGWPVIVMTGHGEVALAVQAIRGGAIDFLQKPFAEGLLETCLAEAERRLQARA